MTQRSYRREGLPAFVSLYRRDPLFRSLLDFAGCGIFVFACMGLFIAPLGQIYRKGLTLVHDLPSIHGTREDAKIVATSGMLVGGFAGKSLLARPRLTDAGPLASSLTAKAQEKLDHGDLDMASDIIEDADARRPEVATASAIILMTRCKCANNVVALTSLRRAAEHGYGPAFALLGRADMMMLNGGPVGRAAYDLPDALDAFTRGDAPALVSIDATGHPRPITAEALRTEAVSWFERGAAFDDATAMRGLGFAQVQGLTGKPNLSAAVAYFRNAANRGDGPSAAEIGVMYSLGAGVIADPSQAERYLRQAVDANYDPALLPLSLILMRRANETDLRTASEAFELAYRAAGSKDAGVAIEAERHIAMLNLVAAPPVLRNMNTAFVHTRRAYELGDDRAAANLARMLHLGVGAAQNERQAKAYALLAKAAGALPEDLKPLADLAPEDRQDIEAVATRIRQSRDGSSIVIGPQDDRRSLKPSNSLPVFKSVVQHLN